MKQLILVEGLPGTGKTTVVQSILERIVSKGGHAVALFEEDERLPCNFYETAGVPASAFDSFRSRRPETEDSLWGISLRTDNYVYLRLDRCAAFIADAFRKWDMGDEYSPQVSLEEYIPCALERLQGWAASHADAEGIIIMDSGFFQNPVNELIFRHASDAQIRSFIIDSAETLAPLNPLCIYLKRESAQAAISFARQAKGSEWSARIDLMLEKLDCSDLFKRRYELELSLLPCIHHIICNVIGDDWSDADRQINRLFR